MTRLIKETTEIEELKFYDYDEKYRVFVWNKFDTVYKSFI
jgi:hypothetical protein